MRKWAWFSLALLMILLDQLSKYWALVQLTMYQPVVVFPVLNWTLAYNSGAAFSFLHQAGEWHRWLFAGFSAVMSMVLFGAIWLTESTKRVQLLALSLILGGAVGNLIDRVSMGYVIDFIQVHYKNYYWPVFNIADSVICIGALLLLIDMFIFRQSNQG
jgi:signal peptidase II